METANQHLPNRVGFKPIPPLVSNGSRTPRQLRQNKRLKPFVHSKRTKPYWNVKWATKHYLPFTLLRLDYWTYYYCLLYAVYILFLVTDGNTTRYINMHKCQLLWSRYAAIISLNFCGFRLIPGMSKLFKLSAGGAYRRLKANREENLTKKPRSTVKHLVTISFFYCVLLRRRFTTRLKGLSLGTLG